MNNANRLLTHHIVIGKTRDGLSQRHLSLCGPSEADGANVMKACQTINLLASDIAALRPSKHPVLSLVARDIEERIAEIARTLQKISEAISDTSTDISAKDVQEWPSGTCLWSRVPVLTHAHPVPATRPATVRLCRRVRRVSVPGQKPGSHNF